MSRAYVCLARNDLPSGLVYVSDLVPNTPQRSFAYQPVGQTHYLRPELAPQFAAVTALAASDPDGVGGDDHDSTAADEYGLAAYLRERVNVNPGGVLGVTTDRSMDVAEATTVANAILDRVINGQSLTLTDINTILNANLPAADNDLEGTAGDSFGTVEEILRILSGEVYLTPANTVIDLTANRVFQSLAERIAAIGANTANFSAQGSFVASTHAAYKIFKTVYDTGALKISAGEGVLSKLKSATYAFTNHLYYYAGVAVTGKTAATDIRGNGNIPATGVFRAVTVYDASGNLL